MCVTVNKPLHLSPNLHTSHLPWTLCFSPCLSFPFTKLLALHSPWTLETVLKSYMLYVGLLGFRPITIEWLALWEQGMPKEEATPRSSSSSGRDRHLIPNSTALWSTLYWKYEQGGVRSQRSAVTSRRGDIWLGPWTEDRHEPQLWNTYYNQALCCGLCSPYLV